MIEFVDTATRKVIARHILPEGDTLGRAGKILAVVALDGTVGSWRVLAPPADGVLPLERYDPAGTQAPAQRPDQAPEDAQAIPPTRKAQADLFDLFA